MQRGFLGRGSVRRTRIITGCTILAALAFVSIHGISRAGVLLSGPYSPGSQRNRLRAAHGDDERTLIRSNDTLATGGPDRKWSLATGGPRRERSAVVYTPLPPPARVERPHLIWRVLRHRPPAGSELVSLLEYACLQALFTDTHIRKHEGPPSFPGSPAGPASSRRGTT